VGDGGMGVSAAYNKAAEISTIAPTGLRRRDN